MKSASAIFMSWTEAITIDNIIYAITVTCLPQIVAYVVVKKEWGWVQRYHHDTSTGATAVGEKAHLGAKQRWLVKKSSLQP